MPVAALQLHSVGPEAEADVHMLTMEQAKQQTCSEVAKESEQNQRGGSEKLKASGSQRSCS